MVKIRFRRIGKKFDPVYQIVVADARAPRDGRFIEKIGYYNPHSGAYAINQELKDKWIKEGVRLSPSVERLFKKDQAQKKQLSAPQKIVKKSIKKSVKKQTES